MTHHYNVCQRSRAKTLVKSGSTRYPRFWTISTRLYEANYIDCACLLKYKIGNGEYGKTNLVWFTSATSWALHLNLVKNLKAETFRGCLKEIYARQR